MKTYVYLLTGSDQCCSSNLGVFATRGLAELAKDACEAWMERYNTFVAALPDPYSDEAFAAMDAWVNDNLPPYAELEHMHYHSYRIEEFVVTGAE